ncbi:hypothetical protein D3C83_08870 [compost metagenome]
MAQALRDLLQHGVPRVAPQRTVNVREPLEVEHQQRHFSSSLLRRQHELIDALVEELTVRQSRQRVIIGKVIELLLFCYRCKGEGNVAGEVEQQPEFVLVKKTGFARMKMQRTDRLGVDAKRQDNE